MKPRKDAMTEGPRVVIDGDILRQIRQHAHSARSAEVCGVLIGSEQEQQVTVEACIPGVNAAQGGTHVTFTQDTWEHIYRVKDADYPEHRIVGWYHSHPGFGVFLSEHDTFIHQNFFSSPLQVAWVYDPHSDEEGCFGWTGKRLQRLSEIAVTDRKGGEEAGKSGKTERAVLSDREDGEEEEPCAERPPEAAPPAWMRWTVTILSYLSVLLLGFALSWFFFPQVLKVAFLVDARTGQVLGHIDPVTRQVVVDAPTPFDGGAPAPPAPGVSGGTPGTAPGGASNHSGNEKAKHAQQ